MEEVLEVELLKMILIAIHSQENANYQKLIQRKLLEVLEAELLKMILIVIHSQENVNFQKLHQRKLLKVVIFEKSSIVSHSQENVIL